MTTFYITTPIYYVNSVPHLGTAYTTIAADALARYRRMLGDDVYFLTGLDEHGQKVAQAAAEHGVAPQEWVDTVAPEFLETWKMLNISNDGWFVRFKKDPERGATAMHDYMSALVTLNTANNIQTQARILPLLREDVANLQPRAD